MMREVRRFVGFACAWAALACGTAMTAATTARAGMIAFQGTDGRAGGFSMGPGGSFNGDQRSGAILEEVQLTGGSAGQAIASLSIPMENVTDVPFINARPVLLAWAADAAG